MSDHPQYASEADLEEDLVQRPREMLSNPPNWIARQLHTSAKGIIDLLGLDPEGRLVVYELKVNRTGRQTMAQILDYASWIDAVSQEELETRIRAASGKSGIPQFRSFGRAEKSALLPTRLVIVAGEANASLTRMVNYVQRLGLDITVETVRHDVLPLPELESLAKQYGVANQWQAALETLDECFDGRGHRLQRGRNGINYRLPDGSGTYRSFAGVYVNARKSKRELGDMFLAVHDATIELSELEFERLLQKLRAIGLRSDRGRVRMKFYASSRQDLTLALRELAAYLETILDDYHPKR